MSEGRSVQTYMQMFDKARAYFTTRKKVSKNLLVAEHGLSICAS